MHCHIEAEDWQGLNFSTTTTREVHSSSRSRLQSAELLLDQKDCLPNRDAILAASCLNHCSSEEKTGLLHRRTPWLSRALEVLKHLCVSEPVRQTLNVYLMPHSQFKKFRRKTVLMVQVIAMLPHKPNAISSLSRQSCKAHRYRYLAHDSAQEKAK